MLNVWEEYLGATTIHGFQYVQRSNHLGIKLFWVMFMNSIALTAFDLES